jgi:hypothetical protein
VGDETSRNYLTGDIDENTRLSVSIQKVRVGYLNRPDIVACDDRDSHNRRRTVAIPQNGTSGLMMARGFSVAIDAA